jgi:Ca2+-binding EF-hand superfamily protein
MGNSSGKKKKGSTVAHSSSVAAKPAKGQDNLSLSYLASVAPPGVDSDAYKQMMEFYRTSARNGKMNREELKKWFLSILPGVSADILDLLFDAFDRDKSGEIDTQEFSFFIALILKGDQEETHNAMFDALDINGDGSLSKDELRRHLRINLAALYLGSVRKPTAEQQADVDKGVDELLDDVFDIIDTDKSGSIDRDEFKKGITSSKVVERFTAQYMSHLLEDE